MKADIRHPQSINSFKDYKSRLQEFVQTDSRRTVHYVLIKEEGPSNAPTFTMQVIVDGLVMGSGFGSSKKMAEQAAAHDAFEKLVK